MIDRVKKILQILKKDLHERDEIIEVAFLSALVGENIFLYGPPGVAKSLISRRISSAFESENYFEYLMQKFSTPEEVFGPISLSELKKDNYLRKTKGYLPEADFGFLDEIWKSNPAILNTLLTIINEKKFKNGDKIEDVPLKVLISASNETPPQNQGLEALYDRFLVRLSVEPLKSRDSFESILQQGNLDSFVDVAEHLKIKADEWRGFKDKINKVTISQDCFNIINAIRLEIVEHNEKSDEKDILYISDRRWQKAGLLLKASAFFCDRDTTNIVDCFLLEYCLWSKPKEVEVINKIYNAPKI
ncbi:AAA family ATPase [Sulfurimonas sp. NW15]|uniref:AAA family ATPase n=1 Tax=Sulfurimonas sp. NW15 TaxID=2922729 RepID=UPI003DAA20A8